MCMLSISNVIYHKFSHGAAFYMLNGKNVNVMLELQWKLSSPSVPSLKLDGLVQIHRANPFYKKKEGCCASLECQSDCRARLFKTNDTVS